MQYFFPFFQQILMLRTLGFTRARAEVKNCLTWPNNILPIDLGPIIQTTEYLILKLEV